MKKIKVNHLILLISVIILSSSCATLLGGKNNTLIVESPTQLKVKVYIDNQYIGDAPGKFKLEKKVIQHGSKLEIKAEGYKTEEHIIIRKQHPLYTIADIFTIGIGLAIDYATGAIYRPIPRKFVYQLEKTN